MVYFNSFEDFIIMCCEMDEWDLRDFLRDNLTKLGFTVQEDDYVSHRSGRYRSVKNMLAIRGDKPRVCLVAHTDVCRDHNGNREHRKAKPVLKKVERFGKTIDIIQDEYCKVQVGGDDRLGVAINTWIAMNTGYDMGLLYTTEEEIGALSADYCSFPELMNFELCAQVDRGNHSRQLVTNIYGRQLCSNEMAHRLLSIAQRIDLPRTPVSGLLTDVLALTENRRIKAAVNMTCGYHASVGSSPNEFITVEEAVETVRYVSEIIKDFDLENINQEV